MPDTSKPEPGAHRLLQELYAVASFYVAHPSAPVPEFVNIQQTVPDTETLERLADELGEVTFAGTVRHRVADTRVYLWFRVAETGQES